MMRERSGWEGGIRTLGPLGRGPKREPARGYGWTPAKMGAPPMGDLPPPNTKRWVVRRKAEVVAAVRSGKITMEEALRRYQGSDPRPPPRLRVRPAAEAARL
jgi:hypothetical protein